MADNLYPIGPFSLPEYSEPARVHLLASLLTLPETLSAAVQGLDARQFATSYRPGGWTLAQVVHHVADSHMNAYIRCRLALTEERPVIKPYDQDLWAELPDARSLSADVSLSLIRPLHFRWHAFFSSLSETDWRRTAYHPEYQREMDLWYFLALYAWHGAHHAAQIQSCARQQGWM